MVATDRRGPAYDNRLALLLVAVPGVELIDVELPIQAKVVGVGAQKTLDVGLGREGLEVLLLEGAQVARPDLRRQLDLAQLKLLANASLAQAVTDLEHAVARL